MDWVKLFAVLFLPARKRLNDESIGDTAGIVIVTALAFLQSCARLRLRRSLLGLFPDIRTSFTALSRL